jgi:hypothetical protein
MLQFGVRSQRPVVAVAGANFIESARKVIDR